MEVNRTEDILPPKRDLHSEGPPVRPIRVRAVSLVCQMIVNPIMPLWTLY
jgi:hypothetical protein